MMRMNSSSDTWKRHTQEGPHGQQRAYNWKSLRVGRVFGRRAPCLTMVFLADSSHTPIFESAHAAGAARKGQASTAGGQEKRERGAEKLASPSPSRSASSIISWSSSSVIFSPSSLATRFRFLKEILPVRQKQQGTSGCRMFVAVSWAQQRRLQDARSIEDWGEREKNKGMVD